MSALTFVCGGMSYINFRKSSIDNYAMTKSANSLYVRTVRAVRHAPVLQDDQAPREKPNGSIQSVCAT